MKRILLNCMFILCILVFSGCLERNAIPNGSASAPSTDTVKGSSDSLPQLYNDRIIYYTQQGRLTHENTVDTVTVFTGITEKSDVYADVYMEAVQNGNVLTYELGCWDPRVLCNGDLFLSDLDGDGTDEIILFMEISGNGEAIAQVFTVQTGRISLLCNLNEVDLELNTIYQDGYSMILENKSVGFSVTVDIAKEFGQEHFDENGKFTGVSTVFFESINSGIVESDTQGELPRISCNRSVFLTNYLGELRTAFQYNPATDSLVLISMDFDAAF